MHGTIVNQKIAMCCSLKAKIHYTSFPASQWQVGYFHCNKCATSAQHKRHRQKSVVSVVSCRFTNSITTTCCGSVGRVANKSAISWQLQCLRRSYGEKCVMNFGRNEPATTSTLSVCLSIGMRGWGTGANPSFFWQKLNFSGSRQPKMKKKIFFLYLVNEKKQNSFCVAR